MAALKVLRVYHSGLVPSWRRREQALRRLGIDVHLATAASWNEGGAIVDAVSEDQTVLVRTLGSHPALFVYDPRPIVRLLRRDRFDLLDFHEEPFSLAAAELVVLGWVFHRGVPFLLYSAQNLHKRYPLPFRLFERQLMQRAAAIYACSEGAAAVLRAKGAPESIVHVLPLGVDLDTFRPSPHVVAKPERFQLLYVGRLLPEKGVDVLIRSLTRLESACLDVIGAGPEEGVLIDLVRELGLEERVHFTGFVSPDDLPGHYRKADVVVIPSQPTPSWTEQFCRVAVEAMACGAVVVTSDSGALPEVVGDAGLQFSAGDDGALAIVLEQILHDSARREVLRRRAKERSAKYSWAEVAAAHADLYRSVAR